jgi:hypothetical protein
MRGAIRDYAEAARLDPSLEPRVRGYLDYGRRYLEKHPDE